MISRSQQIFIFWDGGSTTTGDGNSVRAGTNPGAMNKGKKQRMSAEVGPLKGVEASRALFSSDSINSVNKNITSNISTHV